MKRAPLVLGVLGVLLSAAAVYLLLRQVSAKELAHQIGGADRTWLAAACGLTVAGYWLRAWRWGEILSPEVRVPVGRLFSTTMVGFLAINTLPARLGEVVRAYALARSERIRTGTVLGSVVIERLFDLAALAAFWALSLLFAPYPAWFRLSGYVTIGVSAAATMALWLLHAGHYDTNSIAARLRRLAPGWLTSPLKGPVASFTAGLRVLGRPSTIAFSGLITAVMWIVNGATFLLVGKSMGLSLPLWAPLLLSFVVCVAIMVPSSPGFIGVLEGSCVVGLALLGVDASRALAYGVLYHLVQVVPLVLFGGFFALRGRIGAGGPANEGDITRSGENRKN